MRTTSRMSPATKKLKQRFRSRLNLQAPRGILGSDDLAEVESIAEPGMYWVREFEAGGSLSAAKLLPMDSLATIALKVGQPVIMGYDERGIYSIMKADGKTMLENGDHPGANNPNNPQMQFINQSRLITGLCTPNNPLDLTVLVKAWLFVAARRIRPFYGAVVDLSGEVPSAGEQRITGVFVTRDGLSAVAVSATPQPLLGSVTPEVDIAEILRLAPRGSTPIWFWRLTGSTTVINSDNSFMDGRNFINVGVGDGDLLFAEVTTTDATPTLIDALDVSASSAVIIVGSYLGTRDDYSATIGGTFRYVVRRTSGGDVEEVAAATITADEDSSGSPALTIGVDTGLEAIVSTVTGIAAQTWDWVLQYTVTVL